MLAPQPYAFDALESVIDTDTMRLHYERHHRCYVDRLNSRDEAFPQLASLSLEQIQRTVSRFDAAVRNHGGGHYNHTLF